jgi:hypothetical protein
MAYNNYFPTSYQPMQPVYQQPYQQPYQQQYQQQYQAQQQTTSASRSINWVQGEEGAKSWQVAPGASVLLMDSENPVFFIKSSDASGMPLPLRIFDYTERTQQAQNHAPVAQPEQPQINFSDYVTKNEFEELKAQLEELRNLQQGSFNVSTCPAIVKTEITTKRGKTNG